MIGTWCVVASSSLDDLVDESVDQALLNEAKRELGRKEMREQRAAMEQLYTAMSTDEAPKHAALRIVQVGEWLPSVAAILVDA
eukprot:5468967-Amphidinium_carterae.1